MKIYQIYLKKYIKEVVLKEIVQLIVMEMEIKDQILLKKKYVALTLNIMVLAMINAPRERMIQMQIKSVNLFHVFLIIIIMNKMIV